MNLFERYYGKSEEELTRGMKELTFKKIKRGFGSTIDELEEEKINIEKHILDLRICIANGQNKMIIELGTTLIEKGDLTALIGTLTLEQERFIS